jgi:hypothetical protein
MRNGSNDITRLAILTFENEIAMSPILTQISTTPLFLTFKILYWFPTKFSDITDISLGE